MTNCNGHNQDKMRFRVEVSPTTHQTLREVAAQEGKHMKVLAEEIFQAYFEQRSDGREMKEEDS